MVQEQDILKIIENYSQEHDRQIKQFMCQRVGNSTDPELIPNTSLTLALKKALQNIAKIPFKPNCKSLLSSLLQILFFGLHTRVINLSVILGFIDDIFDCLPLLYQQHLFSIVENEMCKIQNVSFGDQDTVLRITNGMLRKIPKSENIEFRGRLQLLLSKILILCHDSGMVKSEIAKTQVGDLHKKQEQSDQIVPQAENQKQLPLTHKLYLKFWGLQKYFADPLSSIFSEEKDEELELEDQNHDGKSTQPALPAAKRKLFTCKLKAIVYNISQIVRIFVNNPVHDNGHIQYHQPVQHLTQQNILQTQLSDPHFRKLFLIQSIIFSHNVINLNPRAHFPLIEQEKKILQDLLKELKAQLKDTTTQQIIEGTLESQKRWVYVKENWKESKDSFRKLEPSKIQEELNHLHQFKEDPAFMPEVDMYGRVINISSKECYAKSLQLHSDTLSKLNLDGEKVTEYIQNLTKICVPLETKTFLPSFSVYYQQFMNALNELDESSSFQSTFENMKAYSLYEWKAMRALARESLRDLMPNKREVVDSKYKEYKMISYVKRKEEHFVEMEKAKGALSEQVAEGDVKQ